MRPYIYFGERTFWTRTFQPRTVRPRTFWPRTLTFRTGLFSRVDILDRFFIKVFFYVLAFIFTKE